VVAEVLGDAFEGGLVSDFYAAYSSYVGPRQRCWAHLLRDAHDLRAAHPGDGAAAWADAPHALYHEAMRQAALDLPRRRAGRRGTYWSAASTRCAGRAGTPTAPPPKAALCRRVGLFLDELLTFVADPTVPADNNLAERSLRPLVIARKVSGGSRSAKGSRVRMALASLFATLHAQGRDPLAACHLTLLTQTLRTLTLGTARATPAMVEPGAAPLDPAAIASPRSKPDAARSRDPAIASTVRPWQGNRAPMSPSSRGERATARAAGAVRA
jgi:hypothetical protein